MFLPPVPVAYPAPRAVLRPVDALRTRICPYTHLHPVTAVSGFLYGFRFVRMTDPEHHSRLLRDSWRAGDGFVVLEHDLLAYGIRELEDCAHDWCVRPYSYGDRWLAQNLGLARFSPRLTRELPGLLDTPARWDGIDGPLASALRDAGYEPHQHAATWHAK